MFEFSYGCQSGNDVLSINETTIENITNTLIENISTTSMVTKIAQNIDVEAGEIYCPDGFNIVQRNEASIGFTQQLDTDTTTNIRNAINNEIDRNIEQDYESRRGWGSNVNQEVRNNIELRNILRNVVNDSLTHRNIQHIIGNQQVTQDIKLRVGKLTGGNCNIDQRSVINIVVQQLMNTVMNRLVDNDTSNRALEIIAQRLKQISNGPLESLGSKKSEKKAPLMYGAIALAIIALIGGTIALIIRAASRSANVSVDDNSTDTEIDTTIQTT